MALVLDATPGGVGANSYQTLTGARAYYQTHYYATEANLDDDTILTQWLVTATRLLDEHFEWDGVVATRNQALGSCLLLWPRWGAEAPSGYYYDSQSIPTKLADATAELARALATEDRTVDSDLETNDIKSLDVGPVKLTFGRPGPKVIPDSVYAMVQHVGRLRLSRGTARVSRS